MKTLVSSLCVGALLSTLGCGKEDGQGADGSDASSPAASKDAATNDATIGPYKDAGTRTDAADLQSPADASTDGSSNSVAAIDLPAVVDCTAPGKSNCFTVAANRGGVQLTCTAGSEAVRKVVPGTPTWTLSCEDRDNEFVADIEFPVQGPGAFDYTTTLISPSALTFGIGWINAAAARNVGVMTELSTNLKSGQLTGMVGADNQLTGVFTATWNAPTADCNSGQGMYPCRQGALEATFNLQAY